MNEVKGSAGLPGTLVFRLGTLGATMSDRFAERIERHRLKPKHVGLLTALGQGSFASQQDLAGQLGVAPSLVVSLADHLETLGAVRRVRDPRDRRRQALTLTDRGHELLAACTAEARALDAELTAHLGESERQALHTALGSLAARAGLPTD
ncbi:MarR family winged helix-turn-helix transcriptional regulator [Streptomyces sp. NPDC052107]|uniref:MarR family winged helix-turn-helix transcriptional regulator n=1 Tax=Streptomyces sp. NPDC052107 TaxID=3155632 RepID=UPI003448FF6A